MRGVRRRFQQYRRAGGIPDIPSGHDVTRRDAFVGAVITGIVGVVLIAPFLIALQTVLIDRLPVWLSALASFALAVLAFFVTVFVGGPIGDHVVDIPREGSE